MKHKSEVCLVRGNQISKSRVQRVEVQAKKWLASVTSQTSSKLSTALILNPGIVSWNTLTLKVGFLDQRRKWFSDTGGNMPMGLAALWGGRTGWLRNSVILSNRQNNAGCPPRSLVLSSLPAADQAGWDRALYFISRYLLAANYVSGSVVGAGCRKKR